MHKFMHKFMHCKNEAKLSVNYSEVNGGLFQLLNRPFFDEKPLVLSRFKRFLPSNR